MIRCFSLAVLSGCARYANYTYTQGSDRDYPSRGENCDFKVRNSMPKAGQDEEIGMLEYVISVRTIDDFKESIRTAVCLRGGDLVVPQRNGFG